MRNRTSGLLAGAAALVACGHGNPAALPVEAKHILTPAGVWFDEACTPTGGEVCGNAVDDNCNGVIDEGCGLAASQVQFEVAWDESSARVELSLSDPQGDKVDAFHRASPSGFRLDRMCPDDGCGDQNVDNLVFQGADKPSPGLYTLSVKLVDSGKAPLPLRVHFGWRVGDRVSGTTFRLGTVDASKTFSFEL